MNPIDIYKEKRARIKYWLDIHEMSRKELAEKLSVSENALNGWLSTKPIPPARWDEIAELFEEPEKRDHIYTCSFTSEQSLRLLEAAKKLGMTVDDFLNLSAMEKTGKELEE